MKLIKLAACVLLLSINSYAFSQNEMDGNPAVIKGKIKENTNDSVIVYFWEDHIYGSEKLNAIKQTIPVNNQGEFSFKSIPINHPARLTIFPLRGSIALLELQLIEPNDNVRITFKMEPSGNDYAIPDVSGPGSPKYKLNQRRKYTHGKVRTPPLIFDYFDSCKNARLSEMNATADIPDEARNILKNDIIGFNFATICKELTNIKTSEDTIWAKNQALKAIGKMINLQDIKSIVQSVGYIEFLYEYTKAKLSLELRKSPLPFSQIFDELKKGYPQLVKEKLLVYALNHSWDICTYYLGLDAETLTNSLHYASSNVKTGYLQQNIERLCETIMPGAEAYNFSLKDTLGNVVTLQDFRGKTVLIDIYGPRCGACIYFHRNFEKVYPKYENDTNFVVIAISTHADAQSWMQELETYSSRKHVNLYTNGLAFAHPFIDFYNINSIPRLLLVDSTGKLVSSWMPQTMDRLMPLLDKALLKDKVLYNSQSPQ